MWGTIVNVMAILAGALLGIAGGSMISPGTRETVTKGVALGVLLVGIQMALETQHLVVVLVSIALGGVCGELMGIEKYLNRAALLLERRISKPGEGGIAKGFVSATLIFCVGAMAIMGSLQSGLTGEHSILYAKSVLDGVISVVLASTLGIGVAFSALPLLIYQGGITLLASSIEPYIIEEAVVEMKASGGLLILAIGLNMLEVTKIRVGNLLPTVFIAVILTTLVVKLGIGF